MWYSNNAKLFLLWLIFVVVLPNLFAAVNLAERWSDHPEWLWFDDFESGNALEINYQDVDTSGFSVVTNDAFQGSHSLQQHYTIGQVDAGWIIRVNNEGFPSHLFMRFYHKFENGFSGYPPKMARVRYRPRSGDWTSVFAVHCWINNSNIVADVSAKNSSQANADGWLPIASSTFSFENSANISRWVCFEMEVQLNTPGQQDGVYRIWADDFLIVERTKVDLRGSESYPINEVMLDCYWNSGSPKEQNRYYDNFVISTKRIGRVGASPVKYRPSNSKSNSTIKKNSQLNIDKMFCPFLIKESNEVKRKCLLSGASFVNVR